MSLSYPSRRTYIQGQQAYTTFCSEFHLRPYPLSESTLRLFAAFLARTSSYATIRTYMAAVRYKNIELGFHPASAQMPLLQLLLRGIKRVKGKSCKPKRLPITLPLLKILKNGLRSTSFPRADQLMLWASFTTAFFGFLRASEFCSITQSTYLPSSTLLVEDVTILPSVILVHLKTSKTDPYREGHTIRLARSGKSVCPYIALHNHLINCSTPTQPLFHFSDGSLLTRKLVSSLLRQLLPSFPAHTRLSSHSFRIGAATMAASKDTPDWLIKVLGRWSSSSYQRYIRTPSNVIDRIPATLTLP